MDSMTTTPDPAPLVAQLLPCPLCNGDELSHGWSSPGVDGSDATGEVQCHACDLLIWKPTEAEAIAAWNTRHRLAAEQAAYARGMEDTKLLNALQEESWDLRSFSVPTGGDDYDVAWRIVGHWVAEPHERVIAEGWSDDPRVAIRAALANDQTGGEG